MTQRCHSAVLSAFHSRLRHLSARALNTTQLYTLVPIVKGLYKVVHIFRRMKLHLQLFHDILWRKKKEETFDNKLSSQTQGIYSSSSFYSRTFYSHHPIGLQIVKTAFHDIIYRKHTKCALSQTTFKYPHRQCGAFIKRFNGMHSPVCCLTNSSQISLRIEEHIRQSVLQNVILFADGVRCLEGTFLY